MKNSRGTKHEKSRTKNILRSPYSILDEPSTELAEPSLQRVLLILQYIPSQLIVFGTGKSCSLRCPSKIKMLTHIQPQAVELIRMPCRDDHCPSYFCTLYCKVQYSTSPSQVPDSSPPRGHGRQKEERSPTHCAHSSMDDLISSHDGTAEPRNHQPVSDSHRSTPVPSCSFSSRRIMIGFSFFNHSS